MAFIINGQLEPDQAYDFYQSGVDGGNWPRRTLLVAEVTEVAGAASYYRLFHSNPYGKHAEIFFHEWLLQRILYNPNHANWLWTIRIWCNYSPCSVCAAVMTNLFRDHNAGRYIPNKICPSP
jgi:hypothetical protein